MSVFVRFGRRKAFLRQGVWRCSDIVLERRLNSATEVWIHQTGGPPIDDRNHDYTAALYLAERWGGKVAGLTSPASKRAADFYLGRRQLKLF